jgi:hypothetical protein
MPRSDRRYISKQYRFLDSIEAESTWMEQFVISKNDENRQVVTTILNRVRTPEMKGQTT